MKQFRIIEVKKGSKIHYEIQEMCSFIFKYWDTLLAYHWDGTFPLEFEYIEKAEKYLKEYYPESRNVVKYINV